MPRTFPWDNQRRYRNLCYALRDQISDDLACIWEDARIGSHANRFLNSISIGNEAIQAFTNCLNREQIGKLDSGSEVTVWGYDEDGEQQRLTLKKNRDGLALEGPWESIMQKNGWSGETRICCWGFPYGERNSGEPRFVFTNNI